MICRTNILRSSPSLDRVMYPERANASAVVELFLCLFFFQAEDGIRDDLVTGVQTCALPISPDAAGAAVGRCFGPTSINELLHEVFRLGVAVLHRGRLHEVRARAFERASDASIESELDTADGIDDDACGVRRVVHLELELDIEGHIAEGTAFEADVRPLAVVH